MSDYSVTTNWQSVGMILYQQVVVVVLKIAGWYWGLDFLSLIFESRLARLQKSQSLFQKH